MAKTIFTKRALTVVVLLIALTIGGGTLYHLKHQAWEQQYSYDKFTLNGREAIMVKPEHPNGKWIVRPAFVGAFPYVDDSLLARGYHVGYYDVTHEYGNTKAQADFQEYVRHCQQQYQLDKRFIIEGFSRGGFFALCYAINHPDEIDKIYVDAPVCDLNSWPKQQDSQLYEDAKEKWRQAGNSIDSTHDYPIQHFDTIIKHHIPVMLVYGAQDTIVPYRDNFGRVRLHGYKNILKLKKPHGGHHPHSLPRCKQIVDFLTTE